MIIVDLFASIVAPCIVPLYDYSISGIHVSQVQGKSNNSAVTENVQINAFVKGLPSAFIGNAIWGFTFGIQETVWIIIYFVIFLWSLWIMMLSCWNTPPKKLKWMIYITGVALVILSFVRILKIL